MYVSKEHTAGIGLENYNDQSHTVHVELDADIDSIAVAVAYYASHTNVVDSIK